MPAQETYFSQQSGVRTVEVIKTHDESFASEVFHAMDDTAPRHFWDTLKPKAIYDLEGLPTLGDPSGEPAAFLWDELREQAHEHGLQTSFFIVTAKERPATMNVFVSPN